jgi:cell division protein FtsB
MNTSMADPIEKLEQLQGVAVDTNRTAKRIDAKTERSRTKRLSAFALVMLLLYFLVTLGLTIKDLNSSVRNLNRTTPALVQSNKNLTDTNQRLAQANETLAATLRLRRSVTLPSTSPRSRRRGCGTLACQRWTRSILETINSSTTSARLLLRDLARRRTSPLRALRRPLRPPSPRLGRRLGRAPSRRQRPARALQRPSVRTNLPCVTIPPLTAPLAVSGAVLQGEQVDTSIDFLNPTAAATVKVLSVFIPLLVAVITKRYATGALKGVMNFVLSVFTGSIGYLVAGGRRVRLRGVRQRGPELRGGLGCIVLRAVEADRCSSARWRWLRSTSVSASPR